jgi:iron transport multicopper oxidase
MGAEPVPNSALVYFAQNGTYLPGFNDAASLAFERRKTYRLRVVNIAAFSAFIFRLDGHKMRIVEADGVSARYYGCRAPITNGNTDRC